MINVEVEGRILTLTVNRTEKANSLTRLMLEEMDAAVAQAEMKVYGLASEYEIQEPKRLLLWLCLC